MCDRSIEKKRGTLNISLETVHFWRKAECPPFQKLTFMLNVTRRTPEADVGFRKNGEVITPLNPE